MIRRSFRPLSTLFQKRFASCLVVAEHNNSSLGEGTFSAIAAASQLGNTTVLVAGKNCSSVAEEASKLNGVSKVVVAEHDELEFCMPETLCPFISSMDADYSHIVMGYTAFGKNILPRAAILSDVAPVSDCIQIKDEKTFVRPMYAGNAIATVQSSNAKEYLGVRLTSFPSLGESSEAAPVESVDPGTPTGPQSRHVAYELANNEGPSLTSASAVVSGGRGMGSEENFDLIYNLAQKIPDCAVGASRAAVDAGYCANDMQVGQTGKVVAPQLYMAVGISGAIQHLAGMKDSKVIVAINKDNEAPIFQVADYGLVADLFEAVPELQSKI